MVNAAYTGDHPVLHRVAFGESLSRIAAAYRLHHWRPLHVFNTKVHPILGPDPDRIAAGEELWIPRSPQGYDRLLAKLRGLAVESASKADQIGYQLEADWHRHQAQRVAFDFAGDVATLLATVAAKAAAVVRAQQAAATAVGRSRAAAIYLARKSAQDLTADLTSTLGQTAAKAVGGEAGSLAISGKKGLDAIVGVSLKAGKSLFDIADLLLDYVSVSSVADVAVRLMTGETPASSHLTARQHLQQAVQSTAMQLEARIHAILGERRLVHGA